MLLHDLVCFTFLYLLTILPTPFCNQPCSTGLFTFQFYGAEMLYIFLLFFHHLQELFFYSLTVPVIQLFADLLFSFFFFNSEATRYVLQLKWESSLLAFQTVFFFLLGQNILNVSIYQTLTTGEYFI